MPDVLTLNTANWGLVVWTSDDVQKSQKRLRQTLELRGITESPAQIVRVEPFSRANPDYLMPGSLAPEGRRAPVFFENRSYEFEFSLSEGVNDLEIRHRLKSVTSAFRRVGDKLRGTVNFGNDVGWFRVELRISKNGKTVSEFLTVEVHPTKMDMQGDLKQIYAIIDKTYPLWRFSFARSTEIQLDRARQPFERLPLLWIQQFKALRNELESNIKLVCNAPHNRLQEYTRFVSPDFLRGRISPRIEQQVAQAIAQENQRFKIRVSQQRLSVDTPENRFVKSVLERCISELERFRARVKVEIVNSGERPRLSEYVDSELADWQNGLKALLSNPLFKKVGHFAGLRCESLVLHNRLGYSGVYRVWQQLRLYLDILGTQTSISMKSVSELYEVWCLLEIRRQILELGFEEVKYREPSLKKTGVEVVLGEDGFGAAFEFERGTRGDGNLIRLRLAHEPVFGAHQNGRNIGHPFSWIQQQKPDIVLEAQFLNEEKVYWVFDAKYRVELDGRFVKQLEGGDYDLCSNSSADNTSPPHEAGPASKYSGDRAPEDGINQMHRYRDAILLREGAGSNATRLKRPVIGACVLYPGWFSEDFQANGRNPYQDAIDAIGIGAFPVLPGCQNKWLQEFLGRQIGNKDSLGLISPAPDEQLGQQFARIAPVGLNLIRGNRLVFVAHVGPDRRPDYLQSFEEGTAKWFHVREYTLARGEITAALLEDVTHCAVAVAVPDTQRSVVRYVYDVRSIRRLDRSEISSEQAGTDRPGGSGAYWLFELGASKSRKAPIDYPVVGPFRSWVADYDIFMKALSWDKIPSRYNSCTNPEIRSAPDLSA